MVNRMKKIFIILIFVSMLILIDNVQNKDDEVLSIIDSNDNVKFDEPIGGNNRLVALTFDDGPSSKTREIVDLLNFYKIKATFFILGERVDYYPDSVIYITKYNHELGNHSYSHPDFKTLDTNDAINEISRTNKAIYNLTKLYPVSFRFPYGSYQDYILSYIDLPIVLWNVDSLDWKYQNKNIIIKNVLGNICDESVVLFHDTFNYKREALKSIIEFLLDHDYEFVTVSELFGFENNDNVINGKIYY